MFVICVAARITLIMIFTVFLGVQYSVQYLVTFVVQHSKVFISVDLWAPQWNNLLIFREYNALCQEHIQDFLKGDSNSRHDFLKGISIAVCSLQKQEFRATALVN